jgi:hypothetical protein
MPYRRLENLTIVADGERDVKQARLKPGPT